MEKGMFLYKTKCPKCGTIGKHKFIKSWKMKGKGNIETLIETFKCLSCRRKWRRGKQINKPRESIDA